MTALGDKDTAKGGHHFYDVSPLPSISATFATGLRMLNCVKLSSVSTEKVDLIKLYIDNLLKNATA